jgi:hypothetical protein
MKKSLLIFCTVILVIVFAVFAYNRDEGPARWKDGITELPQPKNESLLARGKYLISKQKYSDQDLEAIALYLDSK